MGIFDKKISPEEVRRRLGLIGPGYTAAARRFEAIKAREVVQYDEGQIEVVAGRAGIVTTPARPPVGVRYVLTTGAAATAAASMTGIEKVIAGWKMGFSYLGGKAGETVGIIKREVGETAIGLGYGTSLVVGKLGEGVGKIGESFGNVRSSFESIKWWLLIPILILLFIAIMISIGYSGLGAPAARVAEREHARVR